MRQQNGWLIADTSTYSNFHRIRVSLVDSYTYYTNDEKEDQTHAHHIRIVSSGNDIDIYYDNKTKLLLAFEELEKIMWDYENGEVKIIDG